MKDSEISLIGDLERIARQSPDIISPLTAFDSEEPWNSGPPSRAWLVRWIRAVTASSQTRTTTCPTTVAAWPERLFDCQWHVPVIPTAAAVTGERDLERPTAGPGRCSRHPMPVSESLSDTVTAAALDPGSDFLTSRREYKSLGP